MRIRLDTQKAKRVDASRQLKLDLRLAFAAEPLSERVFADELEISKTALRNKLDPEHDAHFSLLDLRKAPRSFRERVLRMLAREDGYDLAPIADDATQTAALRRSADLLSAASATAIGAIEACADDVLDRSEASRLKPLAQRVRQVATSIERQCDRAISEGVVSLTQKGGEA